MRIPVRSFITRYDGLAQLLRNDVSISQPFQLGKSEIRIEQHNAHEYRAIWDTGANLSAISKRVVNECNLISIGMVNIAGVSGVNPTHSYYASIWLPNKICLPSARVSEGKFLGDFDVLIGMDIITTGDFTVNNLNGFTTFSFRVPSLECTDYTHPVPEKLNNNPDSPCLCGSGKPFKDCHGREQKKRGHKRAVRASKNS